MRFKAILNNPVGLYKLGQTMEKLGPVCIASFTTDKLRFITYQDNAVGPQAWTDVVATSLFSDYRIESQHHNEINFFFKIPDLLHITKDLHDIIHIQLALKRRGEQNIILFRWSGVNFKGSKTLELKELPIELVRRDRLELIKEPVTIRTPETYILLPPLASLKTAAEQFKKLSKYITIAANMNGELKIEVESAYAVSSAQFDNLSNPRLSGHEPTGDLTEYSHVRIKSEDFDNFLSCTHLEPNDVICNIASEAQIVFLVYLNLDTYQNSDAPIRTMQMSPNRCQLTCHLPIHFE
ncbi:hypothetical protein MBANPS3_003791 [Mucor bainieri]